MKPDNTSAILAVREAALMPLQMLQNRYFGFLEELARIWTEFWLTMYGSRALKLQRRTAYGICPLMPTATGICCSA